MTLTSPCPSPECWQALFGDTAAPGDRENYERHLETCPVCQERLDRAEDLGSELRGLARQVGDPTAVPTDPTLAHFLEQLYEDRALPRAARTEPADLYFLRPADRPGVLGMLGEYEVREVIGEGGMGVVLLAFEPALQRLVAIKVLAAAVAGSATARRRFTREAQAAAAVSHDHIVAVHGVHEIDGLPYLVMQYVPGESLQQRLDRVGPLEKVETVRIGLQTAQGLATAHAQGLIHRDIKPANLLLENGLAQVKITDFGLARMVDDVGITQAGTVAGTPEYMAPEQARGEPVDHRADLFSLGSVLYACCTGRPPFRGASALAVVREVSEQAAPALRSLNPDVSAWLQSFIARLMAKNPADRFQTAAEVVSLLEGYLAHLRQPETTAAPELRNRVAEGSTQTGPRPPRKERTRWLAPSWLAVCLLLLALGLTGSLRALNTLFQGPPPPVVGPERLAFQQDFRGGRRPAPPLVPCGSDAEAAIKSEDKGLRITLPKERTAKDPVGLELDTPLEGDFEITVRYELLQLDRGKTPFGVGLELWLATATPTTESAGCYRLLRSNKEGHVFACTRNTTEDGKRQGKQQFVPTFAASGRLRLMRQGTEVTYWAAEGDSGDYRQLWRCPLGPEDVKIVRVAGMTTPGSVLDLRLVELQIRLGPAANGGPVPAAGRPAVTRGWLVVVELAGLGITLALLALGSWWFFRRGEETAPALTTPELPAQPHTAPAVSFPCPECGKTLKVKADLAGKRGKCPQCGQAVQVPGRQPGKITRNP